MILKDSLFTVPYFLAPLISPQHVVDKFDRAGVSDDTVAFAFVTDQLSEEQQGCFTLDTTQAHFHTAKRDYTLIDTPGHREFLKNLVTGATRAMLPFWS